MRELSGCAVYIIPNMKPMFILQDSDVQAEATRVLGGATNGDDAIVMKNLVKVHILHILL